MRLAFYKAEKGTVWSRLIAMWTQGPYSHVELVFNEGTQPPLGVTAIQHDPHGTLCFSSAENDNGTRFKILDMNDGKWDFIDVKLDEQLALADAKSFLGLKYDWKGIMGFVFAPIPDNKYEYYCSEIVTLLLQQQGLVKDINSHKTSPNQLYARLKKGV